MRLGQMGRTANHVIGLLEQILGPAEKEKRFPWARGDPSPKTGRQVELPFDAFWRTRRLIVEVDEDQHTSPDYHFDKPHKNTISGVHRGDQRRLYDERKRAAARAQGFSLVVVPWPRGKHPDPEHDLRELRALLKAAGVVI
jgi:hypothetical protein